MASNTENLNLLMKNPSTDGADTFNVQTMLNENWQKIDNNAGTVAQTLSNILKPTTPPIIGLPPSTTPDGMFQALGNTGELHVWRKTVTLSEEKPAGYTFGAEESNVVFKASIDAFGVADVANSVSVGNDGSVGLVNPATDQRWSSVDLWQSNIRGKFVKFGVGSSGYITYAIDGIFYITPDAIVSKSGSNLVVSGMKRINGYPLTPAGTTTTYPVSTNPKAYQEGDDAKAAGYVLGDAKRIVFYSGTDRLGFKYGDAITVSDDGKTIDIENPSYQEWYGSNINNVTVMSGKFIRFTFYLNSDHETSNPVYFMPSTSKMEYDSDYNVSAVVQPVTGYAAIPAGTTIEYLGKLGDKARVQVLSYVGTGTYGSSNPCSLTFDFPPKVVMFLRGYKKGSNQFGFLTASHNTDNKVVTPESLTTTYTRYNGFGGNFGSYAKKSKDGKTIFWYNEDTSTQANNTGYTYYYMALG